MTAVISQEVRDNRARDLENENLNGLHRVFVELAPASGPDHALLDVYFINDKHVTAMRDAVDDGSMTPQQLFRIAGGARIRGGNEAGRVRVTGVADGPDDRSLKLTVRPIGDYSTYTLSVHHDGIDPVFAEIGFKFRPGCFNTECAPDWDKPAPAYETPAIDYLAKDFDSFKHTLINAMAGRVPDWAPTSEADLDQVLIDLIAADADELSDFQDRVANEAYFTRARKRVSLARHARLMDYHIHQGNQASGWLALDVARDVTVPAGFGVWSTDDWRDPRAVVFATGHAFDCRKDLNRIPPYTWGGLVTALEAGSTRADLKPDSNTEGDADTLRDRLRSESVSYLLLQQALNPDTGTVHGVDTTARQVVKLLPGDEAAETMHDPFRGQWLVRARWREADRLERRHCLLTECDGSPIDDITVFHGNLMRIAHGRPHKTVFRPPGAELGTSDAAIFEKLDYRHYESTPWGVLCTLPDTPLAYRDTPPGGDARPVSTLEVGVEGSADPWSERIDRIESDGASTHFLVETDELGVSRVRFGNGVNGMALPAGAEVTCHYQTGRGSAGNVGGDSLTGFDPDPASAGDAVKALWNPLDLVNGRDPEPVDIIRRRAPRAYRYNQKRAVTLEDYRRRAESLAPVAAAHAQYAWTGSWRTVRVAIDPKDAYELSEETRRQVHAHLDAVRLIGEDLEIRPAQFVALDIRMKLCIHPRFWPEDLAAELEMTFSDGYTLDGEPAFFHPDRWTFGQPLHASRLIAAAMAIAGVYRVLEVSMRRFHAGLGPSTSTVTVAPDELPEQVVATLEVRPWEIIRVQNDPNHLEHGRIQFDIMGGRR